MLRGDFAAALATPGGLPFVRSRCLVKLGRADEAARDEGMRYPALLHAGRAAELLAQPAGLGGHQANEALICLGRLVEAAGAGLPEVPGSGSDPLAMLLLDRIDEAERHAHRTWPGIRFMQAIERGDAIARAELAERIALPRDLGGHGGGWFALVAIRPFSDALAGDREAPARQLRPLLPLLDGIFGRRPWFLASALLGDIKPDAVALMTAVSEADAWRMVATGMHAELAGDTAAARTAYAAFQALPMHQRLLAVNQPDPEVEWFVRWRLRTLKP